MARHESGAAARSLRQWPLVVVVIGVTAGLAVAVFSDELWRLGCLVIGASLGVGAVERMVLPNAEAGLLRVRGRAFDIGLLTLGAVVIVALAIAVPGGR